MITMTAIPNAACAPTSLNPGRVLDDLTSSLREHGMPSPLRGLADPRLDHPDLLIVSGWEREDLADGFGYHMIVDQDAGSHERWEQYYEHRIDGRVLVTRAGHKTQTIIETLDGRVRSSVRYDD